jgi:hypothetical protein
MSCRPGRRPESLDAPASPTLLGRSAGRSSAMARVFRCSLVGVSVEVVLDVDLQILTDRDREGW